MEASSIKSEVISRLAEAVEEKHRLKIQVDSDLREDLDLDSLRSIELMMDLENVFDIEIEDEEIEVLETVADVIRLVEAKKTTA